jgi:hypothetical protein
LNQIAHLGAKHLIQRSLFTKSAEEPKKCSAVPTKKCSAQGTVYAVAVTLTTTSLLAA